MHSPFRKRGLILAGLLAVALAAVTPIVASAAPEPGARPRGFRLFARSLGAMTVNRIYCGLASDGEVCVDSTNSSTIGGGFWPKGTADQYIFNSGLQIAGIIGPDGGSWAGDTTGAFFFDPKGTTQHGEEVEPIYNSSNPDDITNWPTAAMVPLGDAAADLFNPLLQTDPTQVDGRRRRASQGDVWWMSWDGNPALNAGRPHPLGVLVEQRGMGWNFPAGNEDIIYFIYTFYNITSTVEQNYIDANIRPETRAILLEKAAEFQAENNAAFGITIPTGGYTVNNMYAAFATDMDVADAGVNYASVNLPFALGFTYDHSFSRFQGWDFPSDIFSAPFFEGTGFAGIKYLKSPSGAGAIQLYSNTINGAPFAGAVNDPQNVIQLWRYLSGNVNVPAGDQPCNVVGVPSVTHLCFINNNSPQDMRFFQSSTALTLPPGGSGSIVVAYIFAAPVKDPGCAPPCDIKPGNATVQGNAALMTNPANINVVDKMTGYVGFTDVNGNGIVEQAIDQDGDPEGIRETPEFRVVRNSLLGKAYTAQAVFDAKFLLPFAPDKPDYFLIPGNEQVTVMWRPTDSETNGDPYFAVAQDVTTALYDPNYRQFDVEGYRIYRGRVDNPSALTLIAQFDYTGTFISDFAGQVNPVPNCAPELGLNLTAPAGGCAVVYDPIAPLTPRTSHNDVPLVGAITQVKLGDRALLAINEAILLAADTAMTGNAAGYPELSDNGVPFAFVDHGVRNNFRYFYSVTAFDFNSFQSGPSVLESERATKSVTPVRPATDYDNSVDIAIHVVGRGVAMDTIITQDPTIDPTTGVFSGPARPSNGLTPSFAVFVSEVLQGTGALAIHLDSITPGQADEFTCCGGVNPGFPALYYMTVNPGPDETPIVVPLTMNGNDNLPVGGAAFFDAVAINDGLASVYGGSSAYVLKGAAFDTLPSLYFTSGQSIGCRIQDSQGITIPAGTKCIYNGPRWFDGPSTPTSSPYPADRELAETFADPNSSNCQHNGGNSPVCTAVGFNNGGALTGVDTIHVPQSYTQLIRRWRNVESQTGPVYRAADINVYWGAGGVVDSVIDITHNLPIDFSPTFGASWGILDVAHSNVAGSSDGRPGVLTANDFPCVAPLDGSDPSIPMDNPALFYPCTATFAFGNTATLGPVAFYKDAPGNATLAPISGNGFAFYVTGTFTMFQMASLPAAGTVWTLRTYAGMIGGGKGIGGGDTGDPYSFIPVTRPMTIVGAEVQVAYNVNNQLTGSTPKDLKAIHTVPDPYYVTSEFESTTDSKVIKFVNLPQDAIIRIYSTSGVLVALLEHHSDTHGGAENWDVRNRNGQFVASGVYFYHVEAGDATRIGRMTIVNFAQ